MKPSWLAVLSCFALIVSADVKVIHKDDTSKCYVNNKAAYCEPEFTNIMSDAEITASSTCGQLGQTERICNLSPFCEDCNSMNRPRTAARLSKPANSPKELIWVSDVVGTRPGENIVNITLKFGKNFDIYYMKMQQSGKMPDAIAIYKGVDNEKDSWKAWQYFSTDCFKAFSLPTSNAKNSHLSAINLKEVQCYSLNKTDPLIIFAPGSRKGNETNVPDVFYDWITASDVRISLIRFTDNQQTQHDAMWPVRTRRYSRESNYELAEEPFRFALANLEVGARCKCNGHSNKCVRETFTEKDPKTGIYVDRLGPLKCDCVHNTNGVDCESCKRGFFDLPWMRATIGKPFQCKACDCNLHSDECSFSQIIYVNSKMESGGVCENCQHNTIGRKCQVCAEGFYRDWTKPFSHSAVCIPCKCHEYGTVNSQTCNRKDGQCQCKPGVTGLECDRCAPGYQQTNDKNVPCIKNLPNYAFRQIEMTRNTHPYAVQPVQPQRNIAPNHLYQNQNHCPSCEPDKKYMGLRRFCRQHAVFMATIVSQEMHADSIRYNVQIKRVWRLLESTKRLLQVSPTTGTTPDLITSTKVVPVWMKVSRTTGHCICPDLRIGQSYLFVAKALQKPHRSSLEFQVDPKRMMVLQWNELWVPRLNKYFKEQQRGSCQRFTRTQKVYARRANMRRMRDVRPMNDRPAVVPYNTNFYPEHYNNRQFS